MSEDGRFPFKLALNTSTLIPFQLDIMKQIDTAAHAGYEGIELWIRDIESYMSAGGDLKTLRRYIQDTGISVVNGIAFFKWADADHETREKGLQQAKKEIGWLAELGCRAVAAPPYGSVESLTLDEMAYHFSRLAEMARATGVEPYLEFWGRAKRLSRISEAVYVALESGVSDAKILFDLFHMYIGGSRVADLRLLSGGSIGIVHVNDYPDSPSRDIIADKDRVFPGDGSAPTAKFAHLLDEAGYAGYLSLELFIQDYGSRTPLETAREGLEKTRKAYSL